MSSTPSSIGGGAQLPLRSAMKTEEDGDRSSPANASLKGTYNSQFTLSQTHPYNRVMSVPALVLCRSTSLQFDASLTPSGKTGELQSLSLGLDGWAGRGTLGPHVVWMIRHNPIPCSTLYINATLPIITLSGFNSSV
jgi:hypothetical protein